MSRSALPRILRFRFPAILLGVALLFSGLPASASATRGSMTTGLSGLYDLSPAALQQTQATGARIVRVVISWHAVAPATPPRNWNPADPADPAYSWEQTDERISKVAAAGFIPLALVNEAPPWAEGCKGETPSAVCDVDPQGFATFAHAAAVRYSGNFRGLPRVQYWEPINEPNLSLFWTPQFNVAGAPVSPDAYRVLLNAFSASVKGVDPSNLILGGGLGPIAVKHFTIGPMQFTRQWLCMIGTKKPHKTASDCEGGAHFDIFDVHPYTTGGPTHKGRGNDVQMGDLGKLQTLLRAAKRDGRIVTSMPKVPLWITEFSWDTNPPDPGGLPTKIENRWIAEAFYLAWKAGVSAFFWYSLYDEPPGNKSFAETLQSGLYYGGATVADNTPKPILATFRFPFVAYPGKKGLGYWGRTFGGRSGKVAIQVFKHGKWNKVATATANASGLFNGTARTGYGAGRHGAARAVFLGETSTPFAMKGVKDFRHAPFG